QVSSLQCWDRLELLSVRSLRQWAFRSILGSRQNALFQLLQRSRRGRPAMSLCARFCVRRRLSCSGPGLCTRGAWVRRKDFSRLASCRNRLSPLAWYELCAGRRGGSFFEVVSTRFQLIDFLELCDVFVLRFLEPFALVNSCEHFPAHIADVLIVEFLSQLFVLIDGTMAVLDRAQHGSPKKKPATRAGSVKPCETGQWTADVTIFSIFSTAPCGFAISANSRFTSASVARETATRLGVACARHSLHTFRLLPGAPKLMNCSNGLA